MYRELAIQWLDVECNQERFGHPGNWNHEVVEFCIGTCLDIVLNLENTPFIPSAREFVYVYQFKVTAKKDNVEVWEDLAGENEHLSQIGTDGTRTFRVFKRKLMKANKYSSLLIPLLSLLATGLWRERTSTGFASRWARIVYSIK